MPVIELTTLEKNTLGMVLTAQAEYIKKLQMALYGRALIFEAENHAMNEYERLEMASNLHEASDEVKKLASTYNSLVVAIDPLSAGPYEPNIPEAAREMLEHMLTASTNIMDTHIEEEVNQNPPGYVAWVKGEKVSIRNLLDKFAPFLYTNKVD